MREWGTVAPSELERIVIVSPHLDDAVLGWLDFVEHSYLEAEWAISAKLAAPAPEQFWRLAPPPPGWEGLETTP
jgi:hypothetical protein